MFVNLRIVCHHGTYARWCQLLHANDIRDGPVVHALMAIADLARLGGPEINLLHRTTAQLAPILDGWERNRVILNASVN